MLYRYVDGDDGDNGNAGTSAGAGNAWATIDYALRTSVAAASAEELTIVVADTASHLYAEEGVSWAYWLLYQLDPVERITVEPAGYAFGAARAITITSVDTQSGQYGLIKLFGCTNIRFRGFKLGSTAAYQAILIEPSQDATDLTFDDCEIIAEGVSGGAAARGISALTTTKDFSNLKVTNCLFTLTRAGAPSVTGRAIIVTGTTDAGKNAGIEITNNTFNIQSEMTYGIYVTCGAAALLDGLLIEGNTFNYDAKRDYSCIEIGAAAATGTITNAIVRGNNMVGVTNVSGHGIVLNGDAATALIEKNYVEDFDYSIIVKEHTGTVVRFNRCFNSSVTGIFPKGATGAQIYGNSVITNSGRCLEVTTEATKTNTTLIHNNTFVATGTADIFRWGDDAADDGGGNECDHNAYEVRGTGDFGVVFGTDDCSTLADVLTAWGVAYPANDLNSVVGPTAGDDGHWVSPYCPGIASGDATYGELGRADIYGRPQLTALPDMGAVNWQGKRADAILQPTAQTPIEAAG